MKTRTPLTSTPAWLELLAGGKGRRALGGSPFDDTIAGDEEPNYLSGMSGNDTLSGAGGDDVLHGNAPSR
jgi:Ca2+-binding RTX toxin-like protein